MKERIMPKFTQIFRSSLPISEQSNLFRFSPIRFPTKNSGQYKINNDILLNRNREYGAYENLSGGIYGALDPNSKRAEEHAERYYGLVRSMKSDIQRIAQNTGFRKEDIQQIKEHVFLNDHDLGVNGIRPFYASYEMSQSWQRLIDGKNIKPQDITLLNHEFLESVFMKDGLKYDEAHTKAEKIYNYEKELKK